MRTTFSKFRYLLRNPIQHGQPYSTEDQSNIRMERLDEDYNQSINSIDRTLRNQIPATRQWTSNRKHRVRNVTIAVVIVCIISSLFIYLNFSSTKSTPSESFHLIKSSQNNLPAPQSNSRFTLKFTIEIDLKNTKLQQQSFDTRSQARYIVRGNHRCSRLHSFLSIACNHDVHTCSRKTLKDSIGKVIDKGFEMTFDFKKNKFSWYKNLDFFVISELSNFKIMNETTILTDITFLFEYKNEVPSIESLTSDRSKAPLIKFVTFKKDFQFLLVPCHWYDVKVEQIKLVKWNN